MNVIEEGVLSFTFDEGVEACQYDQWAFYRHQFQNGCYRDNKAVDFLCYGKNDAWFVEVKDYRDHSRTKAIDLADEIAVKVRDTLAGLVAAHIQANDTSEKNHAEEILRRKNIRIVCHLEQPSKPSRLRPRVIELDKLQQKLQTLLKAIDRRALVVDREMMLEQHLPWRVK